MNKFENEISDCLTNSVSELNPSFELKENTFARLRDNKRVIINYLLLKIINT